MDILLDQDFDLAFAEGDLLTGDDTEQRIKLLLDSAEGHWKQWPTIGANVHRLIAGGLTPALERSILIQLEADNLNVSKIKMEAGLLKIDLR